MIQATWYFPEHVTPLVVDENHCSSRYRFYIYVNEERLENVVNPIREKENTGNFLVLVDAGYNVHSQTFEED